MFFGVLFLIGTALLLLWWYIQYYRYFNGVWSIPTPKICIPLLGHLWHATTPENIYWDIHKQTMDAGKGQILRGAVGFYFFVNIIDPVILESILSNTSVVNKSHVYTYLQPWLGTGLLISNLEKWRGRRKILTPAYHFKILEQFIDVFDKNSKILVGKLAKEIGKEKVDVFPYVKLCALDTICETAMGTSVNAQECADSQYVKSIHILSDIVMNRIICVPKQFDFVYRLTEDYRTEKKHLKILHNYTMSVIQSRRTELIQKQNRIEQKLDETLGYKEKIPFLDILLQATLNGTPLTDEDIQEEVDTFMFEGHDTTSSAISFCIYSIAKHPEIQTRLLEEQRVIFDRNPDRETTYQDLQDMKYMEMVIKETLRLYPPVPFFGRLVSEDFTYEDYRFKKGTEIGIMVYSLHRNPKIYPNPEVFDPERFTPEEQAKRHPYAFLPFSAGFRNCVGQKFAMLEMKATLGMLIRKLVFHEAADCKIRLKSGLILSSATGVNVRVTSRAW